MSSTNDTSITTAFLPRHLELFARASHDRNPLHLSGDYSRRSPYGVPVVFGALGGLIAAARAGMPAGARARSFRIEFHRPMFSQVAYTVESAPGTAKSVVRVRDGSALVLKASCGWTAGTGCVYAPGAPSAGRTDAAVLGAVELGALPVREGLYTPDGAAWAELAADLELGAQSPMPVMAAVLMLSSYLIGMEAPGREAIFSSLDMQFPEGPAAISGALAYRFAVAAFDERFARMEASLQVLAGDHLVAEGRLLALLRPQGTVADAGEVERYVGRSNQFAGLRALVVGGSRGLGATLTQALALHGATVIATYRDSASAAQAMADSVAGAPGRVCLRQGDATNPEWCRATAEWLAGEFGGLDLLVLNSAPTLQPLRLEPAGLGRLSGYLASGLAMVTAPLAHFLPDVGRQKGKVAVISSVAMEDRPGDAGFNADHPHYLALKGAVEALVRATARQYPNIGFLVARPPALATDMTNFPAREGRLHPAGYARHLLDALRDGKGAADSSVTCL